jgi:uncharacterized protein
LWVSAVVLIGAGLALVRAFPKRSVLALTVESREVPADGYSELVATIRSANAPQLSISNRGARVGKPQQISENVWRSVIRAGIMPGDGRLVATSADGKAETALTFQPYLVDREADGMPDAVELDSPADQQAFRQWFTFLAEAQFFQGTDARPAEIIDCAALIRYAYREALKSHDAAWAREAMLPLIRAIPSVQKYEYPYTLLRADLFRIKPGAFDAHVEAAFGQFADAQSLQRFNSHFVSRDIARAEPGDLLFYRHDAADLPFHGMIYVGESQVQDPSGERFLVYHTGPDGPEPGEIRRPTVMELLRHPNPAWRPLPGNPTFLGVFRWNILPSN